MPTWEDSPTDEKYIVFKREEFYQMMGLLALPPWMNPKDGTYVGGDFDSAVFAEDARFQTEKNELKDAVVIRRQDKFASPCLATYAAMIGLVASEHQDPKIKADLLDISDYFERQAQLAAEEGFKLPDL